MDGGPVGARRQRPGQQRGARGDDAPLQRPARDRAARHVAGADGELRLAAQHGGRHPRRVLRKAPAAHPQQSGPAPSPRDVVQGAVGMSGGVNVSV